PLPRDDYQEIAEFASAMDMKYIAFDAALSCHVARIVIENFVRSEPSRLNHVTNRVANPSC
ncbi:MAG: hypothetical protein ACRD37_00935, partial [Candidatus Acidiferrales bacterium]